MSMYETETGLEFGEFGETEFGEFGETEFGEFGEFGETESPLTPAPHDPVGDVLFSPKQVAPLQAPAGFQRQLPRVVSPIFAASTVMNVG